MKFITIILGLSLFLGSCSHMSPTRDPSSAAMTIDEALSFKKSDKKNVKDSSKGAKEYIDLTLINKYKNEYIVSKNLSGDVAFKVELDVVEGKYVVRVYHSPDAFFHHQAVEGVCGFLANLSNNYTQINTPLSVFEMYYNGKEGDIEAINNLLKLRQTFMYTGLENSFDESEELVIEKAKKISQEMQETLASDLKKVTKERKVKKEARKAIIESLDKASEDKQFKMLIAKNDRIGAAELLKKYLPFEDMPPFEKRYWENYLDIIKHPVPHDQRIYVYRGIDDDFIHLAVEHGDEIDKDTAIKEGKAFLMSTVLVKNQGSWNRRLRSLETMEEKFIGVVNNSSEYSRSARITTMFKNHSADPKGSPFLSFTPNVSVARQFGNSKSSILLVDPRMLQFNFTSGFDNEKEFLAGLMTFPDEMVAIWTADNNSGVEQETYFKSKLADFVENKFGKAKKDEVLKEIEKNTFDYFSPVYKIENSAKVKSTYAGSVSDFFKKFTGKKAEPVPSVDIKGNLNCNDLIKAFWIK